MTWHNIAAMQESQGQPMTLSELIAAVGDDNVKFQNLDVDLVAADLKGGHGTITFATDPKQVQERALRAFVDKPTTDLALVVWIPKDKLPEDFKQYLLDHPEQSGK